MSHITVMKQALDALTDRAGTWGSSKRTLEEQAIEALRAYIAQPESEPTHFICHGHLYTWPSEDNFCGNPEDHILLYAAPQVADYVPLTDAQIIAILGDEMDSSDETFVQFARAIERAVRGKP